MFQPLHYLDLTGTFIFALSGATVGVRQDFDIFGVFVLAFTTATGGGIIRDICIASAPPAGLVSSTYLIAVFLAIFCVTFLQKIILSFTKSALFFDALGLGFFAAFGANKSYQYTGNIQISVILGCISAIGGGCLRDILTGQVPTIFKQEIYASAAIVGAGIELLGSTKCIPQSYSIWLAILTCTAIRMLALKYHIRLPSIRHDGL
ncbi:membrane protein [[Pantoea] beijingensis]|uniref:Membrane protein n=1 Tax=[Pantoea] beijingensis TaxID=1324864 RepID=A0A443IG53_9GAMM|nr:MULTISPECIES: trimeric intracellular cation channel family protein [Erwiniaceae]RWR03038.1 membrane protein [[Pantoea] beijingensis]